MKQSLILLLATALFFSCNDRGMSKKEKELLSNLGFNHIDFAEIRKQTYFSFEQLSISEADMIPDDTMTYAIVDTTIYEQGVSLSFNHEPIDDILYQFKEEFNSKGYQIFISERSEYSPSTISIIKSTDQFDILLKSNSLKRDYEITQDELLKRLKTWDKLYGIEIIAARTSTVEIKLKTLPENLLEFSQEVMDFCPRILQHEKSNAENLSKKIEVNKKIQLSWGKI